MNTLSHRSHTTSSATTTTTTTTTSWHQQTAKTRTEQQQHQQHQRRQPQLTPRPSKTMSFTIVSLLALLISISAFSARADAKPLNQNQVKFRRLPPKEFSAALGSSITVECEAGASPPPTIHWLRDGKRILQNDFDENQLDDGSQAAIQIDDVHRIALSATRSRLFIDCASFQDEATYTCVAENAFSRVSAHTKLNLIRPVISAPASASGSQGADNDLLSEEVAALEASGADKSVGGLAAVPQCLAQQAQRRARQAEEAQQGQQATTTAAATAAATLPVRIHMWTHNIIEIMKNNVILYCRSNVKRPANVQQIDSNISSPSELQQQQQQKDQLVGQSLDGPASGGNGAARRPQVSWSLPDDKPVTAELRDKYEILDTGDLLIKDLRWADMGSYVCTVADDSGSDSISTFVYPASSKVNSKRSVSVLVDQRNFR